MGKIYENIDEYNQNKKRKILTLFDDMISDILSDKIFIPIVTEIIIRDRKLNISIVFITYLILLFGNMLE